MIKSTDNGLLQYRIKQKGELYFVQALTEINTARFFWQKPQYEMAWRYAGQNGYPIKLSQRLYQDTNPPVPPFDSKEEAMNKIYEFWRSQTTEVYDVKKLPPSGID